MRPWMRKMKAEEYGQISRALGGMQSLRRRYQHVGWAGNRTPSSTSDPADRGPYNEGCQLEVITFEIVNWEAKADLVMGLMSGSTLRPWQSAGEHHANTALLEGERNAVLRG